MVIEICLRSVQAGNTLRAESNDGNEASTMRTAGLESELTFGGTP